MKTQLVTGSTWIRNGLRKPIAKISGSVCAVPAGNMLPVGIVYVVPTPGDPIGFAIGTMRRILPLALFVFADVRCASQFWRPARSSVGLYPCANGFVLS